MDNTNQSDQRFDRRGFLGTSAAALAGSAFLPCLNNPLFAAASPKGLPFKISLAEWSLHKSINGKKISNLDFPRVAKEEFGINAIEYVNQFFKTEVDDPKYMTELKQRCADLGVRSLLIMVDGEGKLGDPNEKKRMEAVENHRRWLRAAKELGCHSIRVNAGSQGSYEEQVKLAADGLSRLSEMATEFCQRCHRREPWRALIQWGLAGRGDPDRQYEELWDTARFRQLQGLKGRVVRSIQGGQRADALRQSGECQKSSF